MTFLSTGILSGTSSPGWKDICLPKIARQGSQQNPDEPVRLFKYDAFADLRGLGWDLVKGLIEEAPIEVQAECPEIVFSNPRALLTSFTQNQAVA